MNPLMKTYRRRFNWRLAGWASVGLGLAMMVVSQAAIAAPAETSLKTLTETKSVAKPLPHVSFKVAQACGFYIVLGCHKSRSAANRQLRSLGGPGVGGGAGTQVVNTSNYPNFRNGWFCVADGPYGSRSQASSIAWSEAVPDAYVKKGC